MDKQLELDLALNLNLNLHLTLTLTLPLTLTLALTPKLTLQLHGTKNEHLPHCVWHLGMFSVGLVL
jgi:hypothetical protein